VRHSGILIVALGVTLAGCNVFGPPSPPAPDASPAIVLPLPGSVTTLPTLRPSRSPVAPPVGATPSASPRPSPSVANPCPTPPPGVCCGIVFGSIQGTVKGMDGEAVVNAAVTLRTTDGSLLGGCSNKATSTVVDGAYAFNAVPFGLSVVIGATAPGYEPFEQTVTLPKGTIYTVDIQMKRST
jgi:hypothetical protein